MLVQKMSIQGHGDSDSWEYPHQLGCQTLHYKTLPWISPCQNLKLSERGTLVHGAPSESNVLFWVIGVWGWLGLSSYQGLQRLHSLEMSVRMLGQRYSCLANTHVFQSPQCDLWSSVRIEATLLSGITILWLSKYPTLSFVAK